MVTEEKINVKDFDVVVVGSGFSGAIFARELAEKHNKKVLVVEKRPHIAGNMYDEYNEHGILVQRYGPHFFNTDKAWVLEFLKKYCELIPHAVTGRSEIDGKYVQLPYNFQTIQDLLPLNEAEELYRLMREEFSGEDRVSIFSLLESSNKKIRDFAELLYEKAFKPYTMKQWNLTTEQIDKSVLNRVKFALNFDSRYLNKDFQYLPKHGFTKLFESMLNHQNIKIICDCDALTHISIIEDTAYYNGEYVESIVYTGPIDELFNREFGILPYRSLEFTYESVKTTSHLLPSDFVSYPQTNTFTRKTEYRRFNYEVSGQEYTTIVAEHPLEYNPDGQVGNVPYYPTITSKNLDILKKYQEKAESIKNLLLVGRLAEYKYFNMDLIIENAFNKLENFNQKIN
ncbi:UDP-galactopyranose mutase [Photobacterium leiognathi]|uniref:UDP-galactopyranose mutase n=1 Tax=Photobacterium leiognathi TaxID=553611 RepID=UPI00020884DD|nr:UDP-galactopyranose mutase [Photobacterium leiognathi]PSW53760.1 UDP-galactopyranose mutase [Photobacterium leiognathi subsp. mandapamensis]GAA04683.1 UDP-galactopyranose mutase [Photobacterium leiognathi subsp. mandapamensis svers.1.1.]